MKKTLLILLILFGILKAGNNQELPFENIVPTTPEAASLGKYGEYPVSMSTGTPNIHIPLGEISGNLLQLPISLSYHGSGNKVEERASWVGLGWTLNAGGTITRSVRGLEDENPNGYFYEATNIPSEDELGNIDYDLLHNIAEQASDGLPDMFFYNVNGSSGSFVYGNDERFHMIPYKNVRVEKTIGSGELIKIKIITDDGTQYFFGTSMNEEAAIETSQTSGGQTIGNTYKTAWYLTEVVSSNNADTITLSYGLITTTSYQNTPSERKTYGIHYSDYNSECGDINSYDYTENTYSVILKSCLLNEIKSKNAKVVFHHASNRDDFQGGKKLDSICFFKRTGHNSYEFNKKFDFYYSYMNNTGSTVEKRLMLDSIRESSRESTINPYRFDYNSTSLPARDSKDQDHWGYYNFKTSEGHNMTLIPTVEYLYETYEGDNREPFAESMMAGVLEEIVFPTGGYTRFEFEPHEYLTWEHQNDPTVVHRAIALGTDGTNPILQNLVDDNRDTLLFQYPSNAALTTANLTISLTGQQYIEDLQGTHHCLPSAYLYDLTSNEVYHYKAVYNNFVFTELIMLTPGHQYMLYAEAFWGEEAQASISLTYKKNDNSMVPSSVIAGGLRIKRIKTFDGKNELVKRYKYSKLNDYDICSGVLLSKPIYHFPRTIISFHGQFGGQVYLNNCSKLITQSTSSAPLGMSGGSPVYYPTVIEYIGENGENGKIEYEYTFVNDPFVTKYPFPPKFSMDWARGKLLKKKTYKYDRDDKDFKIVHEVENEYNDYMNTSDNAKNIYGLKAGFQADGIDCVVSTEFGQKDITEYFVWDYFNLYSRWLYQTKSTERMYDLNSDLNYTEFVTEYYYDNPLHTQATSIIYEQSDGTKIMTENRYLEDIIQVPDCSMEKSLCLIENDIQARSDRHECWDPITNSDYTDCRADYSSCVNTCFDIHGDCDFQEVWLENYFRGFVFGLFPLEVANCDPDLTGCLEDCIDDFEICQEQAIEHCCDQVELDSLSGISACNTAYANCTTAFQQLYTTASEPYIKLYEKHSDNSLIEIISWRISADLQDTTLINGTLYLFDEYNTDQVLLSTIKSVESESEIYRSNFVFTEIDQNGVLSYDSRYEGLAIIDEYDDYDNITQFHKSEDVSNSFIWGGFNSMPVAQVINAESLEVVHTGFESGDNYLNCTVGSDPVIDEDNSVTGESYYNTSSGAFGINSLEPGDYYLTFWSDNNGTISYGSNITVNDSYESDTWNSLYKYYIYTLESSSSSNSNINITSGQKIDNVSVYPVDAQMNSFTYDLQNQQTSISDVNNFFSKYDYDLFNRLEAVKNYDNDIQTAVVYNLSEEPVLTIETDPVVAEVGKSIYFYLKNNYKLGTIQSYAWDFIGDGATQSTDASPYYQYTSTGEYTVKLTVTDNNSKTGTIEKVVNVIPERITGSINVSPQVPLAYNTVNFSSTLSSTATSWDWDFGDGTAHSSSQSPTHSYSTPGTYKVTLKVNGSQNKEGTIHRYLYIAPFNMDFDIEVNSQDPAINTPLTFEITNENFSANIEEYIWEFGDGTEPDTTTTDQVVHTFSVPDKKHSLNVTVIDEYGNERTKSEIFEIKSSPITNFSYQLTGSPWAPDIFTWDDTLTAKLINVTGGYEPYSIEWEFRFPTDTINSYITERDIKIDDILCPDPNVNLVYVIITVEDIYDRTYTKNTFFEVK